MPKITEPDYFLPEISAIAKTVEMNTGSTHPILIVGACKKTGDVDSYVVKLVGGDRMIPRSCCFELIASFIAMELEMSIPDPAIIEITQSFVDIYDGINKELVKKSIGKNFGSKYKPGYPTLLNSIKLTPGQYARAVKIFSFDIFISNADRRIGKPNMLIKGDEIVIIDHELAFGFILELFYNNPTPWILRPQDDKWIKNHFFYKSLKGNEHNFDDFVDKLSTLDENFWNKLYQLIPDEWNGSYVDQIKNDLSLLVQNKTEFKAELKRILSC